MEKMRKKLSNGKFIGNQERKISWKGKTKGNESNGLLHAAKI